MLIRTIYVLCGARKVLNPETEKLVYNIGEVAKQNISIVVCGGGEEDAVLEEGGEVIGISDIFDDVEVPQAQLTDLIRSMLNANQKPIILLNYGSFWDYTLKQIERIMKGGFVCQGESKLLIIVNDFAQLQEVIASFSMEAA